MCTTANTRRTQEWSAPVSESVCGGGRGWHTFMFISTSYSVPLPVILSPFLVILSPLAPLLCVTLHCDFAPFLLFCPSPISSIISFSPSLPPPPPSSPPPPSVPSSHLDNAVCPSFNTSNGNFSVNNNNSTSRYFQGASVFVQCNASYMAVGGVTTATCNDKGVWFPSTPGCDGR